MDLDVLDVLAGAALADLASLPVLDVAHIVAAVAAVAAVYAPGRLVTRRAHDRARLDASPPEAGPDPELAPPLPEPAPAPIPVPGLPPLPAGTTDTPPPAPPSPPVVGRPGEPSPVVTVLPPGMTYRPLRDTMPGLDALRADYERARAEHHAALVAAVADAETITAMVAAVGRLDPPPSPPSRLGMPDTTDHPGRTTR